MSQQLPKIPRTRRYSEKSSVDPHELERTSDQETVIKDASSDWHMHDGPVDWEQLAVAPTVAFSDVAVREEVSFTDRSATLEHGNSETTNGRLELPTSQIKYSNYEVVLTVVSILSYIFDVGSDIFVAVVYYRDGDMWWFALTVVFIVVPSLTITVFSFVWYVQDRSNQSYSLIWPPRLVLVFLQLAPLLRFVVYLVRKSYSISTVQCHGRKLNGLYHIYAQGKCWYVVLGSLGDRPTDTLTNELCLLHFIYAQF